MAIATDDFELGAVYAQPPQVFFFALGGLVRQHALDVRVRVSAVYHPGCERYDVLLAFTRCDEGRVELLLSRSEVAAALQFGRMDRHVAAVQDEDA